MKLQCKFLLVSIFVFVAVFVTNKRTSTHARLLTHLPLPVKSSKQVHGQVAAAICGPPGVITDKYHKNKAFPLVQCIRRYV